MEPLHPHQEDAYAPMVREEWRRRQKKLSVCRWTILGIAILTFCALWAYVFLSDRGEVRTVLIFIGAIPLPLVLFIPFSYLIGRCPRCATHLTRVKNPRFCWNCGVRLREDDQ